MARFWYDKGTFEVFVDIGDENGKKTLTVEEWQRYMRDKRDAEREREEFDSLSDLNKSLKRALDWNPKKQ